MIITDRQWQFILLEMLGLRSGATPDDINSAASYAMDCGNLARIPFPPIPADWDELLFGTIKHMQEFVGYKERYLLIVSKSSSENFEYKDCFAKCSHKPTKVWYSTSLDNQVEALADWVGQKIPTS